MLWMRAFLENSFAGLKTRVSDSWFAVFLLIGIRENGSPARRAKSAGIFCGSPVM
jgi:hypothetical protein